MTNKSNLKPALLKYTYDNLMTDALKDSQDKLVAFGRKQAWDEILGYLQTSIIPMFDFEPDKKTAEIVLFELQERRKTID